MSKILCRLVPPKNGLEGRQHSGVGKAPAKEINCRIFKRTLKEEEMLFMGKPSIEIAVTGCAVRQTRPSGWDVFYVWGSRSMQLPSLQSVG